MDRGNQSGLSRPHTRPWRSAMSAALLAPLLLTGCNSLAGAFLKPSLDTSATTLEAGDFTLDPAHAALIFRINHLGFADYVGRFDRFEASLSGDAAAPADARVEAIVDMRSLNIANTEFAAELMGPGWFDSAAHPQAIFRSQTVRLTSPGEAEIDGTLTLKGVSQPITLTARLNGSAYDPLRGADVVGFSATGEISRSAFGIDKFSGLLTDTVRIEIDAEFIRRMPD